VRITDPTALALLVAAHNIAREGDKDGSQRNLGVALVEMPFLEPEAISEEASSGASRRGEQIGCNGFQLGDRGARFGRGVHRLERGVLQFERSVLWPRDVPGGGLNLLYHFDFSFGLCVGIAGTASRFMRDQFSARAELVACGRRRMIGRSGAPNVFAMAKTKSAFLSESRPARLSHDAQRNSLRESTTQTRKTMSPQLHRRPSTMRVTPSQMMSGDAVMPQPRSL
jgi:hypothetical protein